MTGMVTMKFIKTALITCLLLIAASSTHAVETDYGSAVGKASIFIQSVDQMVDNIIDDSQIGGFVRATWLFFSAVVLIPALLQWARNADAADQVIMQCLMIMITGILLFEYQFFTGLLWDLYAGVAGGIQRVTIGGTDTFIITAFINDVVKAVEQTEGGWLRAISVTMSMIVIMGTLAVLSAIAFFVNLWCLWQFSVAKIIGFFVTPLLLSKRFHFVFDGWLRFMLGAVIYGIIARINLVLVALLLRTFYQLPSYASPTEALPMDIKVLPQMVGIIGFMLIGMAALIQTGRFAQSIVSGAQGFGDAIQRLARLATTKIL
jgi:hypothetical protein